MARKTQKNRYELTHADGHKTTIVANSYNDAQRACHTFCVDAVQVQRLFSTGQRGATKNVSGFWGLSLSAHPTFSYFSLSLSFWRETSSSDEVFRHFDE